MSGIRHNNQTARLIASALMILLDNHQTCQLAMSSGKGLQREGIQARQFAERFTQLPANLFRTLRSLCRLKRMQVGKLRQGSHLLVYLGVVLHGTGPQGVETVVHTEVIGTQVGIVPYHRHLIALRQRGILLSAKFRRNTIAAILILRQRITASPLLRQLENQISV